MSDVVKLKPFDGNSDYSMWKYRMMLILVKEKCEVAVTQEWDAGVDSSVKKQTQRLALTEIMMRLTDEVARQVMDLKDPKKVIDKLDSIYLAKNVPSFVEVVGRFFNYKLDVNVSLQENFDDFLKLTQEVARCDEHIKSSHHAIVLLNALPSEFNTIRAVLRYTNVELTTDKIKEMLVHENKILRVFKSKGEFSSDIKSEVMFAKGNYKKSNGKNSHNASQETSDEADGPSQKGNCHYCGKPGHWANKCRKKKKDMKDGQKTEKTEPNAALVLEKGPIYELL